MSEKKMKKIIVAAAMSCLTYNILAGVLYWTVNDSASLVDINGNTPSDTVTSNYNNWDTAYLAYRTTAPSTVAEKNSMGTPVSSSPIDGDSYAKLQSNSGPFQSANIDSSSYSSGLFYIELYNSTTKSVVGRSTGYYTWDSVNNTLTPSSGSDFTSFSQFSSDIHIWNGGSTYVAVPEPTSGVMLLLGAALLGLRRRRA